jgi:hypothetical protein
VVGASVFLVCFAGLFAATSAGSLVSLLGDELTEADLTGPNPVELSPLHIARVETAGQVSEGVGDAASGTFP